MTVKELNEILRREFGSNPYGEPIFMWSWSEDLFWPAYTTGKMVEKCSPGGIYYLEPEYRRDRMSLKLYRQWVVTKWLAPKELVEEWKERFPGMEPPVRGHRILTDYYNKPSVEPFYDDTMFLIAQLKEQLGGMTKQARELDMRDDMDRGYEKRQEGIEDSVSDSFTAFLNPTPGKRGGSVSPQTGIGESPHLRKKEELIVHG